MLAVIDESRCVGCTKCLPPCPTDAIVGASRQMHTVIAALCTGCELCIAPCPVDCITLVRRDSIAGAGAEPSALDNRRRYHAHRERDAARAQQRAQEIVRAKSGALAWPAP
jgi:electron transport complex protein RnfB